MIIPVYIFLNAFSQLIISSAYAGVDLRYQTQSSRNMFKLKAHAAPFDSPAALQDMVDR